MGDSDGRLGKLITQRRFKSGIYKLTFEVAEYFKSQGKPSFYPSVDVQFEIKHPEQHYHVPLLLTPYSYTTYRGS